MRISKNQVPHHAKVLPLFAWIFVTWSLAMKIEHLIRNHGEHQMTIFWRWPIEPLPTRKLKTQVRILFCEGYDPRNIPRLIPENCKNDNPKKS